ncbi:hypothetical protein ABZ756_03125 [Mammaliicoccus sciuri]|uniref:hypothetical protein n=1 Tax=Sporosarcina aquimarina TaxID=114975 RepID=UPI001C8D4C19|nr:hypothetical protein [Sporosarcina aquimarina]MBY0221961.1 hypothetical protein [Sporosarcina aquimarina]
MEQQLTSNDFFFCYTRILSEYLKENGIFYLLKAKSIRDGNTFTLYLKTDELQKVLKEYNFRVAK